jgi:alpha-tubulin suppressor-like RCC1 family protein
MYGVVGDGTTTDRAHPTAVAGLARVAQIAVGPKHACARLDDGSIECWGNNFYGQMGPLSRAVSQAEVSRLGDTSVLELAPRRLQMSPAVDVAVGERLSCARLRSGDVACLGQSTHTWGLSPPTAQVLPTVAGATALALGAVNHCVLMHGGAARCWGANIGGELLDGTRSAQRAPVASVRLSRVSNLVMSMTTRACAVGAGGEVQCWGDPSPESDQLRRIELPVPVTQLTMGNNHGCAVARDGSVFCWGDGFWGQTGSTEHLGRQAASFWSPPRRVAL